MDPPLLKKGMAHQPSDHEGMGTGVPRAMEDTRDVGREQAHKGMGDPLPTTNTTAIVPMT